MKKKKSDKDNYIYSYYQGIKDGSICVGQWIQLTYEHIIKGLNDKLFVFDQKKANAAIEWIETHCFHTEGPLAPGAFKLELWQKAMISCIFGICDAKTGNRQFREIVLIVARKNGKSLLASAIAKYIFQIDGGFGARVFTLAPKLEQADIIYSNIWQMVQLDPEWQALKIAIEGSKDEHNKKQMDDSMLVRHRQTDLFLPGTNSTVKKIAFSAKKSDGFNPSLTICDEIASWQGDQGLKQYEVMKSGMGARPEGLLLSCSTSGYVNDSIFDELIKRSTRFLLGDSKEKRLLPLLYMIDDTEKWNDLNELRKSNPNMGVSITEDYMLEEIAVAEGSLSKKAEFMTKYCNIKQNSSMAWFNQLDVDSQFGEPLKFEDFSGCYAVGGIDLSQTTDLTACVAIVEKDGILNVFSQFFMPSERIDEATARDGIPYNLYIKSGHLKASGDNFMDYHDCYSWFTDLIEKYKIYPLKIGFDRYSAQYLVQDMSLYGFNMDDVFQGENLTPCINELDGLMRDRVFNFGDNNLLKMHLLDSALKANSETNRKRLIKTAPTHHIDGCAALLDAMTVRQKYWDEIGLQLQNKGK